MPCFPHRLAANKHARSCVRCRARGLIGNQLAVATQTAHAAWPGLKADEAEVVLSVLEASGLPPRDAVALWLTWGSAAAAPDFLTSWQQLAFCGTPRKQRAQLLTAITERNIPPGIVGSGMQTLTLIGGDVAAAAAAAAADHSLLLLPAPSRELQQTFSQLRKAGCPPLQVIQLAKAGACFEGEEASYLRTLGVSLRALKRVLGSWAAAAQAALQNERLLSLKAPRDALQICKQLQSEGASQQQLVQIAELPETRDATLGGLRPLQKLLGSMDAALAVAASDPRLLRLPTGAEAEHIASQLHAAGVEQAQLLQLLSNEFEHMLASPTLFSSLWLLRELQGDWNAAVGAALSDRLLLRLPAPSEWVLARVEQLRSSSLSQRCLARLIGPLLMIKEEEVSGLVQLRMLLGSWRAAGEAALIDASLFSFPALTAEQQELWAQLAASGLSQMQLVQLAQLVHAAPGAIAEKLSALQTANMLLGGSWRAAAEAALVMPSLLSLPAPSAEVEDIVQQLDAGGYSQLQRVQLVKAIAGLPTGRVEPQHASESMSELEMLFGNRWEAMDAGLSTGYVESMRELEVLFGDRRAALDAIMQDPAILSLPTGDNMQVCTAQPPQVDSETVPCFVDTRDRSSTLTLLSCTQVAVRQLGAAGLEFGQLLQLAQVAAERFKRGDDCSDRFRALAERLYGGDWKAASLKFLQERRVLEGCLWSTSCPRRAGGRGLCGGQPKGPRLRAGTSERQQSETKRQHPRTPDSERQAAAEAALERQGFKATGGMALELVQMLVKVSM